MKVYLDNNATSRLAPKVLESMLPYMKQKFGNASSVHSWGREAKRAMDEARKTLARILGAERPQCICFTGSGSEADNLAVRGVARAVRKNGNHIVTSAIEHSAVLNTCRFLEKEGFAVTYVKPDEKGMISAQAVTAALREDTVLISIMHANNETGTINPIAAIGQVARRRNILFHTDAVQSFCKVPFTVDELGVDLLSISAHKIHGPKGAGALYIRDGVPLIPLIYGGHQEENRRAGTENVAGIVGLAYAAETAWTHILESTRKMRFLRDRMESGLLKRIPHTRLNGHPDSRLPNTLNLSFSSVESEALLLELDLKGVAVSSGSACTSGEGEPSYVLLAMGIPHEICRGALRFSLGQENTEQEIDYVLDVLPGIVQRIRDISPLSAA